LKPFKGFTISLLIAFTLCFRQQALSYIIKHHFDSLNIPSAPDYSNNESWAALPQRHDFADSTPYGLTDGQEYAEADVFFIHPTTYTGKPDDRYDWNADIHNTVLNNIFPDF